MNYLLKETGWDGKIVCDSAGTSNYHIGATPDRRMMAAAARRGIEMQGRARQFQQRDFEEFDLILAMDAENYRDILRLDPHGKHRQKVRLMCEFASNFQHEEVPDPYYGKCDGFDLVIDLLLDACQGLLEKVVAEIENREYRG